LGAQDSTGNIVLAILWPEPMVETSGLEPPTPCLQRRISPLVANGVLDETAGHGHIPLTASDRW